MCGIAGIIGKWPGASETTATAMRDSLQHRGPDDCGLLVFRAGTVSTGREIPAPPDADAILIHTRLSIIDLTETGWQPMSTPDGRFFIVFNGEIYNYLELRSELEALGVTFFSHSDTEVLLHAFVHWGADAWLRFTGMFACAILDIARRRVTLARDPFGIKPLYYVTRGNSLAFASEIKTLIGLPGVSRMVDAQRLADYLRFGVTDHGDGTLFAEVRQVPAGSILEAELSVPGSAVSNTFWVPTRDQKADISFDEAAQRCRELFLESISLHLRSDVPVACCLSGGLDSSSIVMAMREVSGSALELHTFSYAAATAALNEERWIDLVGSAAGARTHKVAPTAAEMAADLETLVAVQDEPFFNSSIYAQYRVMKEIGAAKIKVVLDGQGADEMLGGYDFYLGARIASLLRAGRLGAAAALIARSRRTRGIGPMRQLQSAMDYLLPAGVSAAARRLVGRDLVPHWLRRDWLDRHGTQIDSLRTASDRDILIESLEKSLRGPGLPQLLRYEDRNSMAWSVESRVPFLTTGFVELLLSLPESFIIGDDGTTKHVFRAAMRGIVPDAILNRTDKIGFATSEREWIMTMAPWVERLLNSDVAAEITALDLPSVRAQWAGILEGRCAYQSHVWRWINLIEWTRQMGVHHD